MKATQIILPFFLLSIKFSAAQNIGIGVTAPQQKLEVNGAVKIGSNDAITPVKGTMRWNNATNQFQGFDGSSWINFGAAGSSNTGIGDQTKYSVETTVYDAGFYREVGTTEYPRFGSSLVKWGNSYVASAPNHWARAQFDGFNMARTGKVNIFKKNDAGKYISTGSVLSPSPGDEFFFGATLAADEQRFVVGEPEGGPAYKQGKVYVYSDITQPPKIIAANDAEVFDKFGSAVAIKNNYVVVGAPYKPMSGSARGKFYIFRRSPITGDWAQHQAFNASADNDELGKAVGITNDWIAVGSPGQARNGHPDHGSVYLYKHNAATNLWSYHSVALPSDGGYHKGFGSNLVMKGDTLMVTESPATPGLKNRIYLFTLNNNVWSQVHEFLLPDAGEYIGNSIDFSGNKVVIAESSADIGSAFYAGKVHYFEWNNGWQYKAVLTTANPKTRQRFGTAALLGNDEILSSSPTADGRQYPEAGLIYIFHFN